MIHLLPKEIGGGIYSGVFIKDVRSRSGARWYLSSNSCNVGTGVDHQWKVIVGGISNKGRKIATGKINLSVVVEKIPLRRETGERVKLKNHGVDHGSRSNKNTKRWRDGRHRFRCIRIHGRRRDGH